MAPGISDTAMITMISLSICFVIGGIDLAQSETKHRHRHDPPRRAEHVVRQKPAIVHLADSRDDGREGAEKGHEPGHDDRLATMPLVELLGSQQVLLGEEQRLLAREEPRSRLGADPVADRVSEDGGNDDRQVDRDDIQQRGLVGIGAGAVDPRRHEQRVAGQEKPHQEAGLGEDDRDQGEQAAPANDALDVVNAVEKVDKLAEHGCHSNGGSTLMQSRFFVTFFGGGGGGAAGGGGRGGGGGEKAGTPPTNDTFS